MPEIVYYKVIRTQSITVASAYGELAAIEAGVAAMDGDMDKLNELATSKGLPAGHVGPRATIRGKHQTDSIKVERKDY